MYSNKNETRFIAIIQFLPFLQWEKEECLSEEELPSAVQLDFVLDVKA